MSDEDDEDEEWTPEDERKMVEGFLDEMDAREKLIGKIILDRTGMAAPATAERLAMLSFQLELRDAVRESVDQNETLVESIDGLFKMSAQVAAETAQAKRPPPPSHGKKPFSLIDPPKPPQRG